MVSPPPTFWMPLPSTASPRRPHLRTQQPLTAEVLKVLLPLRSPTPGGVRCRRGGQGQTARCHRLPTPARYPQCLRAHDSERVQTLRKPMEQLVFRNYHSGTCTEPGRLLRPRHRCELPSRHRGLVERPHRNLGSGSRVEPGPAAQTSAGRSWVSGSISESWKCR